MKTILVIDDDLTVHEVLSEVLSSHYEIIDAYDGKEGIKKFTKNKERLSLILLDMTMPDKTGLEVLQELRGLNTDGVPVVMLTSVDEYEVESACIEAGAVDYIKKPINVKVMKARINAHIALRKSAGNTEIEHAVKERAKIMAEIADETLKIILREGEDSQFTPALVNAMLQMRNTVQKVYPN